MRPALLPFALLLAACSGGDAEDPPPDTDTGTPTDDTAGDTATTPPVRYDIEVVHSATFPDLQGVAAAFVNPVNGYTYVLDEPPTMIRYLLDTWVYPTGDWCVGGTEDEDGTCHGEGVVWTSGRIESPKPTQSICHDPDLGLLYELKGGGENIEVIDIAMEGGEPYTYNRAVGNPDVPPELSSSGSYVTGCDVVRTDGSLVLISAGYRAMAVVGTDSSSLTADGMRLLEFEPDDLTVSGSTALMVDRTHNRLVTVDLDGLTFAGSYQPETTIADLAVERSTGTAWLALGDSGVARIVFGDDGSASVTTFDTEGAARQVVTDDTRHIAWVAVDSGDGWSVALLDADGIRGTVPVAGEVLRMADPAPGGDVPVFYRTADAEPIAYDVLAPMPDRQELDPLNIFLFTTIEEPSDVNMTLPCSGSGTTFATEMSLVRNNAAVLASLGVPIVMAITDNFAEKAEECGETAIFQELIDYGFELGVMLHNRPCYNCTNGSDASNPDYCNSADALWGNAASETSCFPDDPEYCALGDWECYHDFLAPRVDVADRNIPGGGTFIVGADRHGMWSYDWIRLYREVERPSQGKVGFDMSMFAGAWAYNSIEYDDPRGKNPAPWRVDRRTAAWHLADIDHWDQDSPRSDLLYLPGINSSTVKLAEQQQSGLYMIDFFDIATDVAYRPDDFEMQWHFLRQAINNRRPGATNAWYFHIHDNGTINLRDASNAPVMVDPDGDGPEEQMASEDMLRAFLAQIDARYVPTGEVAWRTASDIRALAEPGSDTSDTTGGPDTADVDTGTSRR